MHLRQRLTVATLSIVAVMGVVGLVSMRINRDIQTDVEDLARTADLPLDPATIGGQALAIEGRPGPDGEFVATALERLPATRRPKLRGAVEAIELPSRTVRLLGRAIRIDANTEFSPSAGGATSFEALRLGARVEISARIDADGDWVARKVETGAIKRTDKVKGTISAVAVRPNGVRRLEIDGLGIVVGANLRVRTPRGPLYRMESAMQMTLAVQECLAASHELVKERFRDREVAARGESEPSAARHMLLEELEDRVLDGYETFAEYLDESRASERAEPSEPESDVEWLAPLEARRATFEAEVRALIAEAALDVDAAERRLKERIEPFLRTEIQPRAHAYHRRTEESLSEQLEAIARRSSDAARAELATNGAGLVLALALGLVVSRSISRPLVALTNAAREVGRGRLETRVAVESTDEVGILAHSFNRMAEELAASTVSVDKLSGVIDSMAGALLLLAPDGRITRVNPAALALLGYDEFELLERPLASLSPNDGGEDALASMERGSITSLERRFLRRDGAEVPVAFSGAVLRDSGGAVRGYVCLAQDLSARKRMEQELRRSLAEKELLLREVHHRVKNNLQVVSSLLAIQSSSITDTPSLERFQESQDRIHALVFVHDLLYSSRKVASIDLSPYLQLLASRLKESYSLAPDRVRLSVDVEELTLDIDRAQACGLIVNELVTNAFKHAFPNGRGGCVQLNCRLSPAGDVVLEVRDDGSGSVRAHGGVRSIGLELVETLAAQLGGRLEIDGSDGSAYRIEFPYEVVEHAA
ncbi:MAG: PAS domain S-box protein [Planctomycetes bacterium]|nr:PAS domain S-box protein [Planctomycetota bacterium]